MEKRDRFEPADIEIYIQEKGIVLREKSLVAYDTETNKIIAIGNEAEKVDRMSDDKILVVSPLYQGKVVDYCVAEKMFAYFLSKTIGKRIIRKPNIAACIPSDVSEVEKKAMEDLLYQAGAKSILLSTMPLEQFLSWMEENGQKKNYTVVVNITKENPVKYVEEQIKNMFDYAQEIGMEKDEILNLFQKVMND